MVIEAARRAFQRMTMPAFRAALLKALGLTLLVLGALWFALGGLLRSYAWPWLVGFLPDFLSTGAWTDWLGIFAGIAGGLALAFALALLIAPVTAIIAGLFLDDVADAVEQQDYPQDPPGQAVPPLRALVLAAKFFVLVVLGNLLALLLMLVPFVNLFAFFVVNGYLLGREFFEFAAMRHRSEADAKALRKRHAPTVFLAGLLIAALLAVPILNLAVPIFAAVMMVHLHKLVTARESGL